MPQPTQQQLASLRRLARIHGVQTEFRNDRRRIQTASIESIIGVLGAMGAPVFSIDSVPGALRSADQLRARTCAPPVIVNWNHRKPRIDLRFPESQTGNQISITVHCEDGESFQSCVDLRRLCPIARERLDGNWRVTKAVRIQQSLPTGYHTAEIEAGNKRYTTHILSAPSKTYSEERETGSWGIFAPLYALHSKRSWGSGDYGDLRRFIKWVANQGGNTVATLPLLPAFLGKPFEPSPYSPVSRLFWNEFFLEIERIPEFKRCASARALVRSARFQQELRSLRDLEWVDYSNEMAAKRRVLDLLARSFFSGDTPRRTAFFRYVRDNPEIESYASFRAVVERRNAPWTRWPSRLRRGELRPDDYVESVRNYFLYAQWLAQEQMAAASREAGKHDLRLYLDMPLGVHGDGYDAWSNQDLFALNATGGAPPDSVFTKGQDWGFAPLHPEACRKEGYRYLARSLRHHLKRAGALRIDHVMGLHRLYWVPRGLPASHGAYVSYPADELYALLCIESHRHRAMIVGENLGTVPPEVNRSLARHGVREMFVAQYEARPHPRSAFRAVPPRSVASLNTHDMPLFQAFWTGLDIEDRRDLGLHSSSDVVQEQRVRHQIRRAWKKLLQREGWIEENADRALALLRASLAHFSASAAELVLVNLEDLWLEIRSQNVPGTTRERINWRRKARLSIEQLRENPQIRDLLRTVGGARGKRNRV